MHDQSLPEAIESAVPRADGILVGGGKMGDLMRAFDWSSSPVGPMHRWPQSLRTALSILLDSRYPMYIGWGPDFTQFYNDAYRPILGSTKHPAALGRSTRETFREIWGFIGPMFERVMSHGDATFLEDQILPMDRYGYVEECYFTFCYSAIRGESGEPGGVFVTVVETTDRVLGERRLRTLREMADRALGAKSVEDACRETVEALGHNPQDIPFALLYLLDDERHRARLVGWSGVEPGSAISPREVELSEEGDAGGGWPLVRASHSTEPTLIPDAAALGLTLPPGPWPEPTRSAAVMHTARAGQESTQALLVVGLSARRTYDDGYRGFLSLVTGQIGTAIANAQAYEEERRRAEILAELDRAKTLFFSNVSHEFRTPLTLLLGPLEDLLADAEITGARRETLEIAHRNALRLLKLVNSLLDFSRIEAGRIEASFEPTDLASLTVDLASSFRSAVERAGLTLTVDCPPLPEPVYVDREMWEKVVLNLLSNAFKHTFEGGIELSLRALPREVEMRVADSGVGIAAEQLPRIFARFHRVSGARSRTQEGSGIGLALVQELVRMHGGTVSVESHEGVGTTFTVRIPLGLAHLPADRIAAPRERQSTALGAMPFVEEALRWLPEPEGAPAGGALQGPGAEAAGPAEPVAAQGADVQGQRIVLADDNADMRGYVARLLRERGWQVEAVADGLAALEAVHRELPDLLLSDVMMPGLDGFGLLKALRSDERTRTLPVILLSARAGEESRVEGMDAGADDYLVKPFSARELIARVESHAALARARRTVAAAREAALSLLHRVFDQAPVAICVLEGPEHRFVLANPLYQRFLPGRELVGRTMREAIPEIEGQGFIELLDQVYRTGQPHLGNAARLLYDRDGDGQVDEAFFNFIYHPMLDPRGEISGVAVVAVEVTEEVRARREAESSRAEAEEARLVAESASRAKSDFLTSMSHELRTPLNAIAGYVQLIEMGLHGPVTPAQLDALSRVQRSQRHLLSLINEVLNLARIETGRMEYTLTDVSLPEAISDMVAIIEPLVAAKGLRLETPAVAAAGGAALLVRADRDRLQQILLNLLSNAVKFTPAGGRIVVEPGVAADPAGTVALRVSDTGVGIPADRLESIFDAFVQVGRRLGGKEEGFGLGLAISRELARGMGGDLTVESVPGAGSTFTLTLQSAS